jgi:5-hydroxyisourate hydrolase-like protein (transthyretin family)
MKSICNFDRQTKEKVVTKHKPSICICLTLVAGLLVTPALLGGGTFSVFATDKEFEIDIDIDEDPIKRGDTQDITVTVSNDDTGKRISDADVKLTVYPPDSDSTSAKDETDDDGEAKFNVKIDDDAETGEYDVKVKVSKNGYDTRTVNTSFDVIKKHQRNHNDDDNNDNEHNGDGNSSAATASAASGSAASSATNGGGSSSAASSASGNSAAAAAAAADSAAAAAAASGGSSSASSAASGGSSSSAAAAVAD